MSNIFKMLDFHLFEGDGGGGGTAAGGDGTGSTGVQAVDAEARAFMEELGYQDGTTAPEMDEPETIVYGKEDEVDGGQVGTDIEEAEVTETDDPEAEFAEMIGKGGRFEEAFGKRVADAINRRFKNSEDVQKRINAYDSALAPLYAKYGLEAGDTEGLTRAIEGDDDIYASRAEEKGITMDEYKENLRLQMEAQNGRSMLAEMQRQQEMQETFRRWDAESEALKEVFPSFDIGAELENPEFQDTLNRVGNVRDAFMITHMEDILSGSTEVTARQTRNDMVKNMKSKAARPAENGVRTSPAIVRKSDPSKLNDADMDRIFAKVEDGETFSF